MTDSTCKIADCDTPKKTRGLCRHHYNQAAWHGYLEDIAEPVRPKLVETHGEQILAMWDAGWTMYRTAKELQVAPQSVEAVLKKNWASKIRRGSGFNAKNRPPLLS